MNRSNAGGFSPSAPHVVISVPDRKYHDMGNNPASHFINTWIYTVNTTFKQWFSIRCYFGSTFCIIHSSAQEYDVNKRTSFRGWVSRTRYVSLSKSFSKLSGAIYEIEVEFNCQNIFRYNDRKLRSDMGSMFNDSLCFADCCRTGCVLTAMHVERKQSLFDSWQLTPAQARVLLKTIYWKRILLTLWILVLAKTHFNRGRW